MACLEVPCPELPVILAKPQLSTTSDSQRLSSSCLQAGPHLDDLGAHAVSCRYGRGDRQGRVRVNSTDPTAKNRAQILHLPWHFYSSQEPIGQWLSLTSTF